MTVTESMNAVIANMVEHDHDEDQLLRLASGIDDDVVFPRLRAMGTAEADLHRQSMRLVRQVQAGRDPDGAIANFLGVVRCGVNGTRSAS